MYCIVVCVALIHFCVYTTRHLSGMIMFGLLCTLYLLDSWVFEENYYFSN